MIEGVVMKELVTHTDERGYFREIIRKSDDFFREGFGQLSVSRMNAGVVKAWHVHKKQIDWWYVACGTLKVVLYDTRKDSTTYKQIMEIFMGDNWPSVIVKIPAGVAHGCKCLNGPSDLFYVTSGVYDTKEEGRISYNDKEIGYDWLKGPEIK